MRLPLASDIKTRDGTLTKDAKVKNAYADSEMVKMRPGVNDLGSLGGAGMAQLLAEWNGLLAVSGDSLLNVTVSNGGSVNSTWADGSASFAEYNAVVLIQPRFVQSASYDIVIAGCEDDDAIYGFYGTRGGDLSTDNISFGLTGGTYPWKIAKTSSHILLTTYEDSFFNSGTMARGFVSSMTGVPSFTEIFSDNTELGYPGAFSANGYLFISQVVATTGNFLYNNGTTPTSAGNWTSVAYPSGVTSWCGVAYLGGYWYLLNDELGSLRLFKTADFVTITPVTLSGSTSVTTTSANNRNNCFVEFGGNLVIATSSGLLKSSDGAAWTSCSSLVGAIYADGEYLYVATTTGTHRSSDLVTFDEVHGFSYVMDNGVFPSVDTATGIAVSDASNVIYQVSLTSTATVDSTIAITPKDADLTMFAETTGAAQSNQQMFLKNSEQAWIYTR